MLRTSYSPLWHMPITSSNPWRSISIHRRSCATFLFVTKGQSKGPRRNIHLKAGRWRSRRSRGCLSPTPTGPRGGSARTWCTPCLLTAFFVSSSLVLCENQITSCVSVRSAWPTFFVDKPLPHSAPLILDSGKDCVALLD